jgi:DNA-binding transcriptional regulator WhiA
MGNKIDRSEAVMSLRPQAQFVLRGDELEWLDEKQTEPTKEEIDAEVLRLENEWTANEYARARKTEYDALNQFELISDDSANNTTTHVDAIAAIKLKHPKS